MARACVTHEGAPDVGPSPRAVTVYTARGRWIEQAIGLEAGREREAVQVVERLRALGAAGVAGDMDMRIG